MQFAVGFGSADRRYWMIGSVTMRLLISVVAGIYIMRKHGILEVLLAMAVIYLVLGGITWVF